MTDACENITFARFAMRAVITILPTKFSFGSHRFDDKCFRCDAVQGLRNTGIEYSEVRCSGTIHENYILAIDRLIHLIAACSVLVQSIRYYRGFCRTGGQTLCTLQVSNLDNSDDSEIDGDIILEFECLLVFS